METGTTLCEPDEAVNRMREAVENLVIGGGPAGSILAMRLAVAGRSVTMLEREREAHQKVCGEFLSPEAVAYLQQAGIEPRELGACAISQVRLTVGGRSVVASLPFTAQSLSRRVLDEALLKRAEEAGCELRRGTFAERLEKHDSGWSMRLRDEGVIDAATVFLATGKHDLNGWERRGGRQIDLVGFKMHWRLTPPQTEALRDVMELFLFQGGYGGLSLVENETGNLCLVMRRRRLRELGGWTGVLGAIADELPLLGERLEGAIACWSRPLAISPIPYGHLGGGADGLWRVGDQGAVIPSFTGDGMSIALHSGSLAAKMFLAGKSAEDYASCLENHLRHGMGFALILSRAIVTAGGRRLAPSLMAALPNAMSRIASWTRVPGEALLIGSKESPATQHPIPIG